MRLPWSFAMISTRPFWKTPTHEYVVPKSIPMTVPRSSWATAAVASAAAASAVRSILLFCALSRVCRALLWLVLLFAAPAVCDRVKSMQMRLSESDARCQRTAGTPCRVDGVHGAMRSAAVYGSRRRHVNLPHASPRAALLADPCPALK